MKFLLSILISFWSLCSFSKSLNQLVVFGDSLSDRGNLYEYMNHQLPMSPPYYE
jgi:phospholipase/lecithinase/hemolysin